MKLKLKPNKKVEIGDIVQYDADKLSKRWSTNGEDPNDIYEWGKFAKQRENTYYVVFGIKRLGDEPYASLLPFGPYERKMDLLHVYDPVCVFSVVVKGKKKND